MYRLLLPVIFSTCVLAASRIPAFANFEVCSKNDPKLNECLRSAVQSGILQLITGSRGLGVLSIDPLQVTKLIINQGTGPVAINLDFNNLNIEGIGKINVEKTDVQLDGNEKKITISFSSKFPVTLHGDYAVQGKVLILPISGAGKSKVELIDSSAVLVLTGKLVKRKGEEHLAITTVELDLKPTKVTYYFENLFNGDKALGDNMNKFLNENSAEIWGELKHSIDTAFASTFASITNRIFEKVPYNEVFPEHIPEV